MIGRRIAIYRGKEKLFKLATIVKHNQSTGKHVIKFDETGTEETVTLNCESFKWIAQPCTAVNSRERHKLGEKKAKDDRYRALVGRRFEWTTSKGRKKKFEVLSYDPEAETHIVQNEKTMKKHDINMNELTHFRWIDTICALKGATHRNTKLLASKYIGVQYTKGRCIEGKWMAYAPDKKGAARKTYIGSFSTEKDAALAHDHYARKVGCKMVNFENEILSGEDVKNRQKSKRNSMCNIPVRGRSQYRGVHWQKNRKRWMARYSYNEKGRKHVNLGAFLEPHHAALAFDHEARKQGRDRKTLNFPDETVTEDQIKAWSTNGAHYRYMRSKTSQSSGYRGVTNPDYKNGGGPNPWKAQVNIKKVLKYLGKDKGPYQIGSYPNEKQAALAFDRVCRRYGLDEADLNFPRNIPLPEARLFDTSCYYCDREIAIKPVATKCNHVFCHECIICYLSEVEGCPCCQTKMTADDVGIRSVTLHLWPTGGITRWDDTKSPTKNHTTSLKKSNSDDVNAKSDLESIIKSSDSYDGDSSTIDLTKNHTMSLKNSYSDDVNTKSNLESIIKSSDSYDEDSSTIDLTKNHSTSLENSYNDDVNMKSDLESTIKIIDSYDEDSSTIDLTKNHSTSLKNSYNDNINTKSDPESIIKIIDSYDEDSSNTLIIKQESFISTNKRDDDSADECSRERQHHDILQDNLNMKKRKINNNTEVGRIIDMDKFIVTDDIKKDFNSLSKRSKNVDLGNNQNELIVKRQKERTHLNEKNVDVSFLKEGDRTAFDFGNDIYFGTIEECSTNSKSRTKWRWTVQFDDGDTYDLDYKDMIEAARIYESIKCKEMNDPLREEKIKKLKEDFILNKNYVLSFIPDEVKAQFMQVGFASWKDEFLPVLFLGPYDISPGPVRDKWFGIFEKCHSRSKGRVPRIVYWFGEEKIENAFSILPGKDCISFEAGLKKGIKPYQQKKNTKGKMAYCFTKAWAEMKESLGKPISERLPFPKLKEWHEEVTGPGADRLLAEVEAEIRQMTE